LEESVAFFASQEELLADHTDAKQEIELVHTALVTIRQLVQTSLLVNGNGVV
jgi:hypothetical protein